jgi:hypothetical protein
MNNTQGLETTDSNNIAPGNNPIPYNPNRHERRFIEKQYRKQYGKESLKIFKAEYKKAVTEANKEERAEEGNK